MTSKAIVGTDGFAQALAQRLEQTYYPLERRRFPDGEVCPRVAEVAEKQVMLASRMQLPADPNAYLLETLLTVRALREDGKTVELVLPYLPYARQDKAFRSGEPVSVAAVLDLLALAGARRIYTVSSHAHRGEERFQTKAQVTNINGFAPLADHLRAHLTDHTLLTAPDFGTSEDVRALGERLGCQTLVFEKERDKASGVIAMKGSKAVKDREVIIIDDMIASGGTMLKAIELCRQAGAQAVAAYAVHGIFTAGVEELQRAADRLAVTDTIDTPVSQVSVVEAVAAALNGE